MAAPADSNSVSATHANFKMKRFIVRWGPELLVILGLLSYELSCSSTLGAEQTFSGLPLFFEPEESAGPSSFLARGQNYQFRITPTGAEIVLAKAEDISGDLDDQSPIPNFH